MEIKEANKLKQDIATFESDLSLSNNRNTNKKTRAGSWLLNLIINMFRPLFEREITKLEAMNINDIPSSRIMKIRKDITLCFEPDLVYNLKSVEMTIDVSHPDTRKVMRLYLTGHTIVDLKQELMIKQIAILNHIQLFHFHIKI